jgi:hypothetical protein
MFSIVARQVLTKESLQYKCIGGFLGLAYSALQIAFTSVAITLTEKTDLLALAWQLPLVE